MLDHPNPLEGQGACSRCAALCCMAPAFDRSQGFGLNKPNATACPNLDGDDRCTIHAAREAAGFSACARYDCGGVGQYVTETVFAGRHWRASPDQGQDLRVEMTDAFTSVKAIAALSDMLEVAGRWDLSPVDRALWAEYRAALWPAEGWTPERLRAFEAGGVAHRVRQFLRSLRPYATR